MDDGLVSVIVPTYNRAYCICRAIESVLGQTYPNVEVLVVDDGSTDDTAALIKSSYAGDARVHYLYQPNAGVSAARNTGIRAARGRYVAFLDSDDQWKPWKLEVQLACFRSFPEVGMVWTNFEAINAAGEVVESRYLTRMYEAYRFFPSFEGLFRESHALSDVVDSTSGLDAAARVYVGNIYTSMLRGNLVHTSTVVLRRERIAKVKEFNESLVLSGEDYDFHFRTSKWGDVCFVDVSSTTYQLGFDDRLTLHKQRIAENFLKTVEDAIARERGNEVFSASMVDEVLAEAHGWVAEEMLRAGEYAGVRRHALLSLRHHGWQPRKFFVLGVAMMPRTIADFLLKTYRSSKSILPGPRPS
jgi:glycosyltransferase involved in cell wall biosynthesis